MPTPGPIAAGGFFLEDGLPDEYYALTDGELSLTAERNGGINTLHVLDILAHAGKLYPERGPSPIVIQREGGQCGLRPLYGPGIQFLSTHRRPDGRPGRNLFHCPDTLELYPFGYRSISERFGGRTAYDLIIDGRSVLFRFANNFPNRDQLIMTLNKDHIRSGEMGSMKYQFTGWWVPEELQELSPDRAQPFPDDHRATLTWSSIGLDAASGIFFLDGAMSFAYGEKGAVVALGGERIPTLRETNDRYLLSFPWEQAEEQRLFLVVAETRAEALERLAELKANAGQIVERKIAGAIDYARRAPRLDIAALPTAAEFARIMPPFERSMVLAETATEACIRAATHKYGFFAMWDQIYPARAFLALGDLPLAQKLLRYMVTLPGSEALIWNNVQIITQIEEIVAFDRESAFLREMFPHLKRFFLTLARVADPRTGLLPNNNSSGVDDPEEIGISGVIWPSCVNGWWYNSCRAMEGFALRLGDAEVEEAARAIGAKVAAHYLPVFFDPERGYLHAVVDPKTGRGTGVYQNVSTLGMDYPYGEYLLHTALPEIAAFQADALCHPNGRSAVVYDDRAHEMWKHVIMFQHLAHETKVARATGLGDEALRIVDNYLRIFRRCKVAMETQNLCGAEGDISQRANWQAFGARACYGALLEGILGLQWDIGGLVYVPCDIAGPMSL
ncbi:MAG TPA: hypothetical protein VGM23_17375, partial [Armatimonadota bacterium]